MVTSQRDSSKCVVICHHLVTAGYKLVPTVPSRFSKLLIKTSCLGGQNMKCNVWAHYLCFMILSLWWFHFESVFVSIRFFRCTETLIPWLSCKLKDFSNLLQSNFVSVINKVEKFSS